MFSSRSVIVSRLPFKSLTLFEFVSCIWFKGVAQFHSLICDRPVFPTRFIKIILFPIVYSRFHHHKLIKLIAMGLFVVSGCVD